MHNEDEIKKYLEAGKILAEVRSDVWKKIKPGLGILDLANFIEDEIKKRGAELSFPVNISIDEHAAHYTPAFNDKREIKQGDLVKIDMGTHIDGYSADSALTYCSEKNKMIETVNKVLAEASKIARPGLKVSEIGNLIEDLVRKDGLGLIVNLTGHGIGRNEFHKEPTIPNTKNNSSRVLQENEVIAIEPFVCEGGGSVIESGVVEIFRYLQDKPVRSNDARGILAHIKTNFGQYPFAKRWLFKKFSPLKVALALNQLESAGAIESYPVLKEKNNKKVVQAEHTIIVGDKPIVTTPVL